MAEPTSFELLAPAGDQEKLQSALHFGADAIYIGGPAFGLRKASKNFSREDLEEAVALAHRDKKAVHVTLNILPHDRDLEGLDDYLSFLNRIKVDACIISDPGIFMEARKKTEIPLHVSTQASVTNSKTVAFWRDLGADRVVLARELSLEEIQRIRKEVPDIDLEVFVHGAMCISYSGRCLLSNYMTGRDANQGDCAQACRWKYFLMEEKRPGEYFPIGESNQGTFIMNSKDLCLLPYLPDLMGAGIKSFKIEGRVKSQYYVSTVVHAYREAMDAVQMGNFTPALVDRLLKELAKTSHRDYTTGFFFGNPGRDGQNYKTSSYIQDYDFLGLIKAYDPEKKRALIEARNRFALGDQAEIMGRTPGFVTISIDRILSQGEEDLKEANVPMELFWIPVPAPVQAGDILRKKKDR